MPKVWICIPVFNRLALTLGCLNSLYRQEYKSFQVVICDHGSTDGTETVIKSNYPDVTLIKADDSLWWTGAINKCISYALLHCDPNDVILTLNNDTELEKNYLKNLIGNHIRYPNSIITSVIKDIKSGKLEAAGYKQNWLIAKESPLSFKHHHLPNDFNVVQTTHASGRGTLIPAKVFRSIGLFDDKRLPHYAADYDFTLKATRAGFKIYACQDCVVLSYIDETGMTRVMKKGTIKSAVDYFTSIRSPANLSTRWWYGWNNCPKYLLPLYFFFDFARVFISFFKNHYKYR